MKPKIIVSTIVAAGSFLTNSEAAVSQLSSRAAVGANDSLDWSVAGAEFDPVSNPSTLTSAGGRSVSVNMPAGSFDGIRLDQDSGWIGGFGALEALFYTDMQDVWVDLIFATPIFAAALEVEPDYTFASDFTARIEAFNSSSTSLGFFDVFSTIGDPALLGVESSSADITRLRLSMENITDSDPNDGVDAFPGFAINQIDFRVQTRPQGVPDGGSMALMLGAGVICLLSFRRQTKKVSA